MDTSKKEASEYAEKLKDLQRKVDEALKLLKEDNPDIRLVIRILEEGGGDEITPYKFEIGERVKITLEGKHQGMVGKVVRRIRWAKAIMPPPSPESIYYVVFEGDKKEYGFGEGSIVKEEEK